MRWTIRLALHRARRTGVAYLMTFVLLGLKLGGAEIGWLWVFAPIWVGILLVILVLLGLILRDVIRGNFRRPPDARA